MAETIKAVTIEHEKLLEDLDDLSRTSGKVGEIYSDVLVLFRAHLERENETVLPLLGYLKSRLKGFNVESMEPLRIASSKLEDHFDQMLIAHKEISRLLDLVSEELKAEPNDAAGCLAKGLRAHIALEEEVSYPAAFAASDLLDIEKGIMEQKIQY